MVAVFQRVAEASVAVSGKVVGECGAGCVVLLGVAAGDTEADAKKLGENFKASRFLR